MRKCVIALTVLCFLFAACSFKKDDDNPAAKTLIERLRELPNLQVVELAAQAGFSQTFQIDIIQPVDHANPAGETFNQRFYLSHRDESKPMVFYTSGYGIGRVYESEPAALLNANQILLVHRFFPDATPAAQDWKYLTILQAANDQHRIATLLKSIYKGYWLSSGASKGGMTALYYRFYFPSDVQATIAYVAPIMPGPDDPRIRRFLLEKVGNRQCRAKIMNFQRQALLRRATLMPLLRAYIQSQNYSFTIIGIEEAFEYSVLEYMFQFWQYGSLDQCAQIPGDDASDQEIFDHLLANSPVSYYADADFIYYQPLFYQAYTEIGYCPYVYEHLGDLLQKLRKPSYRAFAPRGVKMTFHPEVMQAVIAWLQTRGERIIYINGGIDPWGAADVQPAAGLDAMKIVQPGANHGVKIADLTKKDLVIQTLERWLNIKITPPQLLQGETTETRNRLGDGDR